MSKWHRQLKVRLWIVSLAFFVAGFVGRFIVNYEVGNVAWSYPIEIGVQWNSYLAGMAVWLGWLVFQAGPKQKAPGCFVGVVLAFVSVVAMISSLPK